MAIRAESEIPAQWRGHDMPEDRELDWHREWVGYEGETETPDECFFCWALAARDRKLGAVSTTKEANDG